MLAPGGLQAGHADCAAAARAAVSLPTNTPRCLRKGGRSKARSHEKSATCVLRSCASATPGSRITGASGTRLAGWDGCALKCGAA
jgi:hypothetical protein